MVLITAQLWAAPTDWGQRKARNITPGNHSHLGKLGWRHVLPMDAPASMPVLVVPITRGSGMTSLQMSQYFSEYYKHCMIKITNYHGLFFNHMKLSLVHYVNEKHCTIDHWQCIWKAQVSISTPVCINPILVHREYLYLWINMDCICNDDIHTYITHQCGCFKFLLQSLRLSQVQSYKSQVLSHSIHLSQVVPGTELKSQVPLVCSTSLMASLIRSVGGLSKCFYQGCDWLFLALMWLINL